MADDKIMLTVETIRAKEEELTYLRTVERPAITEQIRKAREYGDLSENFEYQAARQSQAILNGKIAALEALLNRASVVHGPIEGQETVGIGIIVKIDDVTEGEEFEYIIVDAASADPINNKISLNSPVGQALMDKRVGDEVEVPLPNGSALYKIVGLRHA